MYTVDEIDTLVPIPDLPKFSSGAPCPLVLADGMTLIVAAYLQLPHPGWDGTHATMVSPGTTVLPVGIVRFRLCEALLMGPPNDEALEGHPLASRGLEPYSNYEVIGSSWVRSLERMNRVHPQHSPKLFESLRHFLITFHNSTLECVARDFFVEVTSGTVYNSLSTMLALLKKPARS